MNYNIVAIKCHILPMAACDGDAAELSVGVSPGPLETDSPIIIIIMIKQCNRPYNIARN